MNYDDYKMMQANDEQFDRGNVPPDIAFEVSLFKLGYGARLMQFLREQGKDTQQIQRGESDAARDLLTCEFRDWDIPYDMREVLRQHLIQAGIRPKPTNL